MLRRRNGLHNLNNPMHMIRHHNRFMQLDPHKVRGNANPTFASNPAKGRRLNLFPLHISENTSFEVRTNSHEIQSRSRIVAIFQTRGWRQIPPPMAQHAAPLQSRFADSYFKRAPISTSSSGNPASTGRPSGPTDAATIIPFDSTPRNFRGAKFTTTATFRPINFSGS